VAADARRRARAGRRVSGAGSWTSGCGGSHAGGGRRAGREQRSRAPAGGLGTQGTTAEALPAGAANQGAKEGGGTVNLARTLGWVNGKNETEGGLNGR